MIRNIIQRIPCRSDLIRNHPARCDRWLEFLSQTIQTPEPIMQVQEFIGYCLTRDARYTKSLLLLGPGADGKSVFMQVVRELVGPENCSSVSFEDLEDQFFKIQPVSKGGQYIHGSGV